MWSFVPVFSCYDDETAEGVGRRLTLLLEEGCDISGFHSIGGGGEEKVR